MNSFLFYISIFVLGVIIISWFFIWFYVIFLSIFSISLNPSTLLTMASNMPLHSGKIFMAIFSSFPELYHLLFMLFYVIFDVLHIFISVVFLSKFRIFFYFVSRINTRYIILSKPTHKKNSFLISITIRVISPYFSA